MFARDTGLVLAYLTAFLCALGGVALVVIGILNAASKDPRKRKGPGVWLAMLLGVLSLVLTGVAVFVTRRL